MKKKILATVGIFTIIVVGLIVVKVQRFRQSSSLEPLHNQFPDTHPLIDYPILCEGDREEEFRKRVKSQSGYQEPEPYLGIYENIWDPQTSTQAFNVLEKSINLYQYPNLKQKTQLPTFTNAIPSELRNYLEMISYRPLEIDLSGCGYYFFDSGRVLTLNSEFKYTEEKSQEMGECFDNKGRIFFLGDRNFPEHSFSPKIPFSTLSPQYCVAHSFLEESNDVFLVCLGEKLSKTEIKILILGFSYNEVENRVYPGLDIPASDENKYYEFTPVLEETFTSNVTNKEFYRFFVERYADIYLSQTGVYYLFTGAELFSISPNQDGYLETKKYAEIPPNVEKFYVSYPRSYENKSYNLPYLFLYTMTADGFSANGLVFDTNKGKFLRVDNESCTVTAPEDYYNDTIDPFLRGPYKTLDYTVISPSYIQVKQRSSNAGCDTHEGNIDVYFEGDSVYCEIKIDGEIEC